MTDLAQHVPAVEGAGYIRKRLLGGYKVTLRGTWYLRDVCARNEEVHAAMSSQAARWEAGGVTKSQRREALVGLVLLGWDQDRVGEAEALASLRAQGFDPLAPEVRAEMKEKMGFDPFEGIEGPEPGFCAMKTGARSTVRSAG